MTEFIELHGAGEGCPVIINIAFINMVFPTDAIVNKDKLEKGTRCILVLDNHNFEAQESFETVKELLKKSILNPPIVIGDASL